MVSIELVDIKNLTLLKDNPRKITKDDLDKLCKSLEKDPNFFSNRPVLVNQIDDILNVYAGNQRVLAAKKLKWKQVPCIIERGLSEEIIKERIIKDNRHSGTWDYDLLAGHYEIETLLECGFNPCELDLNLEIEELEEEKKSSKKNAKLCPNCGHEL